MPVEEKMEALHHVQHRRDAIPESLDVVFQHLHRERLQHLGADNYCE